MPPNEVFLSHSSRDGDMAKKLADVLAKHGIPVFYGPQDIKGGQQWQNPWERDFLPSHSRRLTT